MNAYRQALFDLAQGKLAAGETQVAIVLLKRLIGAGGDDGFLLYALGNAHFVEAEYEAAAVTLRASVRIDPNRAEAFNDLAAALFALGREAEALACLRRSLVLNPDLAEAQETDAIWLLRYGRFRDGWLKYEARLRTHANRALNRPFEAPQWLGEALNGRTILLHAEQGLGDAVQFVRYAPLVAARGGRVILEIYPEIVPLLGQMRGIAAVVARGEALPAFDIRCSLLSLPLAFRTVMDSIPATVPYLSVPPERVAAWRRRLGPRAGLRVGLAWSGNPQHRDNARRSIDFTLIAALVAAFPKVTFYVTQTGREEAVGANLVNFGDRLRGFGETGALLMLMDLVISVDTSVAHLAGALGRPVWLLLMQVADWRWLLERDDSPWYPTMELFRQTERGDWDGVLRTVSARLREMLV